MTIVKEYTPKRMFCQIKIILVHDSLISYVINSKCYCDFNVYYYKTALIELKIIYLIFIGDGSRMCYERNKTGKKT